MLKMILIVIFWASGVAAATLAQELKECSGIETSLCQTRLAQAQDDCSQLIQKDRQAAQQSEFCKTLITIEWGEGW